MDYPSFVETRQVFR